MADEMLEIADDSRNDWIDKIAKSGEVVRVLDEEAIARSRMRIATRQWLLSKALPHAFGDRIHQNLTVEDITPRPQRPAMWSGLTQRGGSARPSPTSRRGSRPRKPRRSPRRPARRGPRPTAPAG